MAEVLAAVTQVSLVLFMAGSLLGMGLTLKLDDAMAGLSDLRFGALFVVLGFGLSPALAFVLASILRLDPAYSAGLMLLGLTPCAPFLSTLANRAGGDKARVAASLLISAVCTILILPLAVPIAIPGMTVDALSIARPLVLIVLLPLAVGMSVLWGHPATATRILPMIKFVTGVATVVMLGMCVVLYGKGLAEAVGTRAIAAQTLFFLLVTTISYLAGNRLPGDQRSVLALGICTRNVGAALAPVLATVGSDQRTVVMVVMGVPLQLAFAFAVAQWLSRARAAATKCQTDTTPSG